MPVSVTRTIAWSVFLFHRNGDRTMGAIIFNGIFYKIVDCTIKKYIAAGDIGMRILIGAVIKMNGNPCFFCNWIQVAENFINKLFQCT